MKAQLVKQCEQRFIEKRCVIDANGNTNVSVGDKITAIVTLDCNGALSEVYYAHVGGVLTELNPAPIVGACNDCQPSVEYQCVRYDEVIPPGPGSTYLQAGGGGLLQSVLNIASPDHPLGCDDNENEYPVQIRINGGVGAASFGPIILTVNGPADWTPDLISAVLNAQPMFAAIGVQWLDSYNLDCVFPASVTQAFWASFSDKPSGDDCYEYAYWFGFDPSSGYAYDLLGGPNLATAPPPVFPWIQGGSMADPQTGTGAYVQFPTSEIVLRRRREIEAVKCVNALVSPPVITITAFTLDGQPFVLPAGSENVVYSAGACGIETESREVCVSLDGSNVEAWLVIGRDIVDGEVVWSRVEDIEGAEIENPVIVDCDCAQAVNVNRACLSYSTSINGYVKDQFNIPPCGTYNYTVNGERGGTPFSFAFTVSGSWEIGDNGFGVAPQAITNAFNAAALAAGITDIQLAGASPAASAASGIAFLYDSAGPNWWMVINEVPPACAISALGLNPVQEWYVERDGASIGESIYAPAGPYPIGAAEWGNQSIQDATGCTDANPI